MLALTLLLSFTTVPGASAQSPTPIGQDSLISDAGAASVLTAADSARIDSLTLQASFAVLEDDHRSVIQSLNKVLRAAPEDSSLHYRIAMSHDALWSYEEAVSHYRRAINTGLNSPDVRRDLATSLIATRQYDAATSILTDLLSEFPASLPLRLNYAEALSGMGNTEKALEDMEVIANMYPASDPVTSRYAETLWVAGQREEAFEVVQEALDNRPEEPFLYALLGEMHLRVQGVEAAHRTLSDGYDYLSRGPSHLRSIFDSGLAYTFALMGRPEKALRHAHLSLDARPHNPYAHRNFGLALLADGQSAAACDAFRSALDRGYERMFLERTQFGPPPSGLIEEHCR